MANTTGTSGELDVEFTPENGAGDRFIGANADSDNTGDKLRGARQLVKDEATKYGGQAGDKLRAFADDGKARATGVLDELAKTIEGAAGTIDEKVGAQFGGYARTASTAVSDFSKKLGDKDIDPASRSARPRRSDLCWRACYARASTPTTTPDPIVGGARDGGAAERRRHRRR